MGFRAGFRACYLELIPLRLVAQGTGRGVRLGITVFRVQGFELGVLSLGLGSASRGFDTVKTLNPKP